MDIENIWLNERSQAMLYMIPFTGNFIVGKATGTESRLGVSWGYGQGRGKKGE
jgi:hypothetical protein